MRCLVGDLGVVELLNGDNEKPYLLKSSNEA